MTSTNYSISAAHRITGKSRTTIAAHMNSGKLSYTEDENGNKVIDASELIRVYGDSCDFEREDSGEDTKDTKKSAGQGNEKSERLEYLEKELEKEKKERDRERALLESQIENLQDSLKLAQEGHNRATLLLENQSGKTGAWEKSISELKDRVANQEKVLKQNQALRKALTEERNKGFWKRLFG